MERSLVVYYGISHESLVFSCYTHSPEGLCVYRGIFDWSKTQATGHCFTDTVTTLTPFLMLTLGLSATLRQCFRPKHYTKTIFGLRLVLVKV